MNPGDPEARPATLSLRSGGWDLLLKSLAPDGFIASACARVSLHEDGSVRVSVPTNVGLTSDVRVFLGLEFDVPVGAPSKGDVPGTLAACRRLLDTHPYSCLCGAGITKAESCEWHRTWSVASEALASCGFPSGGNGVSVGTPTNKERNDGRQEHGGTVGGSGAEGPQGPGEGA